MTQEVYRTFTKPIGECIYCGRKDNLGDEHVVPFSLGGNYVLGDASCADCSTITSRFERQVARGFAHSARLVGNFPTRRPGQRPDDVTITAQRGERLEDVILPRLEAGAILPLPLFKPPGLVEGRPHETGVAICGVEIVAFGKSPAELAKSLEADGIQATCDWDLTSYARLIAKVAYGFAIGFHNLMPREQVPILPLILGKADDAANWIGSAQFTMEIEKKRPMHAVSTRMIPDPQRDGGRILLAHVKLFASAGVTGYDVVVWRG